MSRLLVLGNAGIDLVCPVPHLPGAGETLVADGQSRAPGGKGLNQAVVAARAGAAVLFAAPVGRDAAAAEVSAALRAEPLASVSLLPQDAATDLSLLMVAPDGENCILTLGAAADALSPAAALLALEPLQQGDMLLLQGNLSAPATLAAVQAARGRGASVMLNTAPMRWDMRPLLPLCAVVVANDGEAAAITELHDGAAAAALHAMGAGCAVVTLGAGGCAMAGPGGLRRHPAQPARAVDTAGAGDTFCGVLAAWLLRGHAMDDAVAAAQRAAAVTVSRPGAFASLPTAAELKAILA
ncbi:PfkB family carbohydrate kinase [Roseomonas haemaphysalidis]|uniref:Ribokinase n=1 Tax=Roseomonas haemaphysalidis TaxID=2768162 RepID=A0ABS3KPM7_9PROT|nr:PfkB family carbohydrate kinase [Roseomonas haemaphysalidis]MBO1078306.1 bifunctional hydroxymethylpyrimidine kinase/phosphomethylpyrimidine kinase [Roseomonas haemaphysalidis]